MSESGVGYMFSVVIPLYNKAHTIRRTIDSVLAQSFGDFEIIVVDDGSTDDGVEILQSINDHRIKIIHQANQGVSGARNKGVQCATFEYVAFLDGDDEWLPGYLNQACLAIEKYPHAGMICCARFEKVSGSDGKEISSKIAVAKKYRDQVLTVNYFENPHVFSHVSMTIIRKPFFYQAGGFSEGVSFNEDLAFLYTVGLLAPVVYCGIPLGVYWGGVQGQATANLSDQKRTIGRCRKFNKCHQVWNDTGRKNHLFLVFERYELRSVVLPLLKNKDYAGISELFGSLDSSVTSCYPRFEIFMYSCSWLNLIAQGYIYATKLLWRRHGFPVVGEI